VSITLPSTPVRPSYRRAAILAAVATAVVAAVAMIVWPDERGLVLYGLYAIPAHLLISVVAMEPVLFETAKTHSHMAVAVVGTLGCLVAIVLDYALIGWIVNRRLIREEIDDSRGFKTAQRFFGRAPFLFILVSALLPMPFYPTKILAIARDYPLRLFCLALAVGRLPRFYYLAVIAHKAKLPKSALVSSAIALSLMAGWGLWRTYRRNRLRAQNRANS
jgi:membrane protein YqaA with SNARE-associated domain